MSIIQVADLVKKYGDFEAVKGVSFQVEQGETFGFLGPNGAGKTTTINILCTLLRPTSGSAILDGWDVAKHPSRVRQSIGLVFQDPSLDDRLTAEENLNFHAILYNVPPSVRGQRIADVLQMVELEDRRRSIVRTFSGGMRRRLEIARGLLHYPKVLFLDEPTIGLDPQTRNHIWKYITELREREKITIFLTTHYMDEANNADRIAIIDHGKIVALDSPDALKAGVGGDIIRLKTENDAAVLSELKEKYGLHGRPIESGIQVEVAGAEEFVPKLFAGLRTRIISVSLHRPTLDDVFLTLTGREIREDEANNKNMVRAWMRARSSGRGPH